MKHKVVRTFAVTDAVAHDSQMFEESMAGNTSKDGWTYWSAERFAGLKTLRYGEVPYSA